MVLNISPEERLEKATLNRVAKTIGNIKVQKTSCLSLNKHFILVVNI